ncbi:DUF3410 domain-containing protein, partial [Candidatus Parcubacteria bacterium]
ETAWLEHPGDKVVDCWENEPTIRSDLLQAALLATPHIAGHSVDAKLRGGVMATNALRRFLALPPLDDTIVADCLPPAPAPLQAPPNLSGEALAAWAVQQAYDFRQDDAQLRQSTLDATHRHFETYRRHYPLRREWSALHLTGLQQNKDRTLLKALGFSTD